MKKISFPPTVIMTALIAAVFLGLFIDNSQASSKSDTFYEGITLFEKVVQKINFGYVEEVDMESVTRHAIDGALEVLDPHTTFFEPKDYEELMVHTEGEFGGLGIQISIRDKMLTVMTPIAGTPAERAGIRSGDRILKIDGNSTKGITLEKAVSQMRGKPGTSVTITIGREGSAAAVDYEIERAVIKIKSVPYVGILKDSIGYLSLTTFSQDAGDAVRAGVDSLINMGAKGIVFDLRFNPGGLLTQAQAVSSVFLPEKKLVVFTQGRLKNYNDSLFTRWKPAVPEDMPVVVMVNGASASAAEIVSGAIQDWDRGVVLGDTTFGKGSVQTVLPIDKERHLKLTTAFYYTPSGRCINRPENGIRGDEEENNSPVIGESEEKKKDSTAVDTSEVYYTGNGRPVYGGGGIIPDTIVEDMPEPFILRKLLMKDLFFKFANAVYPSFEKNSIDTTFQVSDDLLNQFYTFLDSSEFDYSIMPELKLKEFKVYLGMEEDTTKDSTSLAYVRGRLNETDSLKAEALIAELETVLKRGRQEELQREVNEIRNSIRMALIVREMGQDNDYVYRTKLESDEQLTAALKILNSPEVYKDLLAPKKK